MRPETMPSTPAAPLLSVRPACRLGGASALVSRLRASGRRAGAMPGGASGWREAQAVERKEAGTCGRRRPAGTACSARAAFLSLSSLPTPLATLARPARARRRNWGRRKPRGAAGAGAKRAPADDGPRRLGSSPPATKKPHHPPPFPPLSPLSLSRLHHLLPARRPAPVRPLLLAVRHVQVVRVALCVGRLRHGAPRVGRPGRPARAVGRVLRPAAPVRGQRVRVRLGDVVAGVRVPGRRRRHELGDQGRRRARPGVALLGAQERGAHRGRVHGVDGVPGQGVRGREEGGKEGG